MNMRLIGASFVYILELTVSLYAIKTHKENVKKIEILIKGGGIQCLSCVMITFSVGITEEKQEREEQVNYEMVVERVKKFFNFSWYYPFPKVIPIHTSSTNV